jgi:hypothetical protein
MKNKIQINFLNAYFKYVIKDESKDYTSALKKESYFLAITENAFNLFVKKVYRTGKSYGWSDSQIINAITRGLEMPDNKKTYSYVAYNILNIT